MGPAYYMAHHGNCGHREVDKLLASYNVGGQLTWVQRTMELKQTKTLTKGELDGYLRSCGVPENKIVEAQKLKIANTGTVEYLEFMIQKSQFTGELIVIKSKKTTDNQIKLLICKELIQAHYSPSKIRHRYSHSGVQQSIRPLNTEETEILTEALKDQSIKIQNQLKALNV